MTDDRPILTPCPACQSEGRILTCNGGPDETDHGPCPYCDATGMALVPTEPITMLDLEAAAGSRPLCPLCEGQGITIHRVQVYEHGCAFAHADTHEERCPRCEGCGFDTEAAYG